MRHFLKMKHGILKITAIFVLLLFIAVYACQEDFGDSFDAQDSSRAIELAKNWYEMNKPASTAFRSSEGNLELLMKPEWKTAFTKKNGKYETVESDLITFGMFSFIHPECMEKFNETGNADYLRSYSRIVFRTDRKTNETVGFLMTQVPNVEFIEKSKFKPFKKTHYLDRDSKFGGWILFHNLDGSFENGWVYEDGEITGKLSHFDTGPVDFSFRGLYCYEIAWYLNYWSCPYWYTGGEDGYEDYCTLLYSTYVGSTYHCDYYDDGDGGEYDGGDGGGDGGGNASNPGQVTLTAASSNITVMDSYGLSVSFLHSGYYFTSIEFKIYKATGSQYTLQTGNSKFCDELAKTPGYWTVKAIVDGTYESNEINVEVQFPDASTVSSRSVVITAMDAAWGTTKNAASWDGREEYCFPIYVNTNTMNYECGTETPGPRVECGTIASFSCTYIESTYPSPLMGQKYAVAIFHTHTPLTYCTSNFVREVGSNNIDNANHSVIPGIIYDYSPAYYFDIQFTGIRGGHDLHSASSFYYCGTTKRATPN